MSLEEPKTAHDEFLAAQLANLPPLPATERLSPTVFRILGDNPGKFTLQGTNTYLVGTGPHRILIDTGYGKPLWGTTLQSVLVSEDASISTCLLTHHHIDHIGGIPDLLAFSPATVAYKNTPMRAQLPINHGQRFRVPGATLTALHTPGHTPDHMCFYLAEENAIFTGDTILGHGTTVFEDLTAYMASLEQLKGLGAAKLYPAHGAVVEDAEKKIAYYIRHRQNREDQVLGVLKRRQEGSKLAALWGGSEGVTAAEIVGEVYKGLGVELMGAAEKGVEQILEKVAKEGKVRSEEGGEGVVRRWFVIDGPPRL